MGDEPVCPPPQRDSVIISRAIFGGFHHLLTHSAVCGRPSARLVVSFFGGGVVFIAIWDVRDI